MMLGGTEGPSSSTQPMEIMGTHMDYIDPPKGPADSTPPNEIASRKHMDSIDGMTAPMDICPEAMLGQTDFFLDFSSLKEEQRQKTNLQHNKPKKANKMVIPQDYVCTSEDIDVVKLMMSAPKNTKFVDIGDALLSNNDIGCLTRDGKFLHDGVINAYIYCISDRGHLRDRAGGRVHLESTFVSSRLKRHGECEIDPSDHHRIAERMDKYLKNDLVFLPINVPASHWYVIVVNAKKRVIQVLDSLGATGKRNEVTLTLRGLERHLKIASQRKDFNIGEKWHDLDVTKWPVVEQFQKPMQTDGASCGLFMLNFMEYWTGEMLSDHVIQEDMNEFRTKLAAILYESELNKIKGAPIYASTNEEENGSDSDIVVLPSPSPKRPESTNVAKVDRVEDKCPIPVHMMPTDQHKLVHKLCKYIMSIQDATYLEQEWVRSSKPYPIALSLKKIQDILRMDMPMDNDCFNLGIRIVACDEILQMVETDVHYMDLRFCMAMIESTRGNKWRVKPNIQALATLFDSWPGSEYKISSRKLVFLPYASMGHFNLFSIDKHASSVSVLDPLSVLPTLESKMARSYNLQLKLQRIAIYLSDALALAQPG